MNPFEYFTPASLEEALSLLTERQAAKPLAGGTDLIVQMKAGRIHPEVIVDVKAIPELNRLEFDGSSLHIGAAVPLAKVAAYPPTAQHFGMLLAAVSSIGSPQLRNRGTVGGNLCNAAPSADSAPPLISLDARAIVVGPDGEETIPLAEFFRAPGAAVLRADQLLVEIIVPTPPAGAAGCYLRHTPRQDMDIAVVGVASYVLLKQGSAVCQEARIALGAVSPTPVRARQAEAVLLGRPWADDLIDEAAETASAECLPITDIRGSLEYRRAIVRVLTLRTLHTAFELHSGKGEGKR